MMFTASAFAAKWRNTEGLIVDVYVSVNTISYSEKQTKRRLKNYNGTLIYFVIIFHDK